MEKKIDLERLNSIDLSKITVDELSSMRNDALRRALIDVITKIGQDVGHYSHGAHSNHYKTIAIKPDLGVESQ